MVETLIEAVKRHEVLYKKSALTYRNRNERVAAWNSISEELNTPVDVCQSRWKTLRDRFVKLHAENYHASRSGIKFEDNSWQYYHQLEFLREHIQLRKTVTNNAMEEKLIEAVKRHEVLYKKTCPTYRKKNERASAWNSIADELNVPVAVCQSRWKTLRDRFVKKHAENYHGSGSGTEFEENPWQYYQQLEFLREHIKPRNFSPPQPLFEKIVHEGSVNEAFNTIIEETCSQSIESLEDTKFFEGNAIPNDVLSFSNESISSSSEVACSSRKKSRREASNGDFTEFLEEMKKIAQARFAVAPCKKESPSHEGFFSMVREIFEDLSTDAVRTAKFYFINYLQSQVTATKKE